MSSRPPAVASAAPEPQTIPPRYWWLKRIGLASGTLIVALVLLRVWWGWEAQRRLDGLVAHYRALGQPVAPEDFATPALADEENAAVYLMQAAAALVEPEGVKLTADDIRLNPELVLKYPEAARELIEANRPALMLVREARSWPRADWSLCAQQPLVSIISYRSGQRALCRQLCASAVFEHVSGNDAEAVELLADAFGAADVLDAPPARLLSHVVGRGLSAVASRTLERVVPDLRIADGGTPEESPDAADRARVEHLIRLLLLQEHRLRENWHQAMLFERATNYSELTKLIDGTANAPAAAAPFPPQMRFILGPAWTFDGVRSLEAITQASQALRAECLPEALRSLGVFTEQGGSRDWIYQSTHLFESTARSNTRACVEGDFECIGLLRLAATALAVRLYEIDYGKRPDSLRQLVPAYLDAVPADPFAADGREIAYLPDAESPRLYCIGKNGVDDGGTLTVNHNGFIVTADEPDLLFILDNRPVEPAMFEEDASPEGASPSTAPAGS